jgi:hypothetical protein
VSKAQRVKGARIEYDIVNAHRHIGVHAERYPLSRAFRLHGLGHYIDLDVFESKQPALVAEVKARKKITSRSPSH